MKCILFGLVLIAITDASIFLVLAPPNRNYEGCRYDEYPQTKNMAANQEVQIAGKCMSAHCDGDGNIHIQGCSPMLVEPPLKLSKLDFTKPFPECCPHPIR